MASLTAGMALALLAAWGWLEPPPTFPPTLSVIALEDITLAGPDEIVVSPDGSRLATVGTVDGQVAIYWRNAAEENFRIVPGTENARFAAFSPDGEWLVYRSLGDEALMKVALSGGAPSVVVPAGLVSPREPHWGDDGTIVFAGPQGRGLYRVPDTGGEPELLLPGRFRTPRLLPGGRGVIVADQNGPSVVLVDPRDGFGASAVPRGIRPVPRSWCSPGTPSLRVSTGSPTSTPMGIGSWRGGQRVGWVPPLPAGPRRSRSASCSSRTGLRS